MACPICGKPSPCAHEQKSTAHGVRPGEQRSASSGQHSSSPLAVSLPSGEILENPEDKLWRQEVVSRVKQHRARRRRRVDPHASMELDFQASLEVSPHKSHEPQHAPYRSHARAEQPKIIEFPRPLVQLERRPEPEEFELAEPVIESPRILDAPDPPPRQMDLLPAFADIQLEAEESRRAIEAELPLQPAAISYRIFAGLLDLMVVFIASALFAIGFFMFANGVPQLRVTMFYGLLVSATLWLIYQYLFLVYGARTPGMHFAQLELCTFTGQPVGASLRRWRALATALSGFAVGLGFAWALVDEDTLGWHDRITQTHVRRAAVSH